MVIKGDDRQATKAINYIKGVKGATLPREVRVADCKNCDRERCSLRGSDKPWC